MGYLQKEFIPYLGFRLRRFIEFRLQRFRGLDLNNILPPPSYQEAEVSEAHSRILRPDNPRILHYKERYSKLMDEGIVHSQWNDGYCRTQIQWPYFRGDNAYIWQKRENKSLGSHELTARYLKSVDKLGLFDKLGEDGAFGVYTYLLKSGKRISRDLLDSIAEISFLEKNLKLSKYKELKVLDIGAGYGRSAHRMLTALPNIKDFYCVDAIAESTFLCEFYTEYRKLSDRARIIALDEFDSFITKNKSIDLAVNIHSFSECAVSMIEWWLRRLRAVAVKYLMIVPNSINNDGGTLTSLEKNLNKIPYDDILEKNGYRLIKKTPKYEDAEVQKLGISPTHYYLFKNINAA